MARIETALGEKELAAAGRVMRRLLPRSAHAVYEPAPGRDPLGILRAQQSARLQWLIQLRLERMSANPFAFYRGTAAIQAADLRSGPDTGAEVVICGDAHLSNFGIYRSPENAMVFDINDFDEAGVGPWEWDVKRLLCSVVLAGRSLEFTPDEIRDTVKAAAAMYRDGIRETLRRSLFERYFTPTDMRRRRTLSPDSERMIKSTMKESEKRTSGRVASRTLEEGDDGELRFVEQPPVLTRAETDVRSLVDEVFDRYRSTLPPNIALLASQYRVIDVARRVVGVGSVGTRCFIIALADPVGEPLILQLKEANRSVVEEFGDVQPLPGYLDLGLLPAQQGYRVVACQRILQAVSDPFLGYLNVEDFSFYMRLFRNRNASFDIAQMNLTQFSEYSQACAIVLARAHARSPKAAFIGGYIGGGDAFPEAVTEWAHAYAAQAEADYAIFVDAVRRGWRD